MLWHNANAMLMLMQSIDFQLNLLFFTEIYRFSMKSILKSWFLHFSYPDFNMILHLQDRATHSPGQNRIDIWMVALHLSRYQYDFAPPGPCHALSVQNRIDILMVAPHASRYQYDFWPRESLRQADGSLRQADGKSSQKDPSFEQRSYKILLIWRDPILKKSPS